jgi:NAD(P)-dependent dehydrogenase (short-subunit alcohol dehydrogenase family)
MMLLDTSTRFDLTQTGSSLMTKTDAMRYAPDRIRVNSIHPGFIWPPMVSAL